MDRCYGQSCHIARVHPKHPCLKHGKIIYYHPDDEGYDSPAEVYSDKTILKEEQCKFCHKAITVEQQCKYDDNIKLIMPNITSESVSSIPATISDFSTVFHDDIQTDEQLATKLTTSDKLNTMIEILEYTDESHKYVILESKGSSNNLFKQDKDNKEAGEVKSVNKLPKPAEPMTITEEKKTASPSRMDWNEYHPLQTIHRFLDDLEYDYPSICTAGAIGKSLEGRDLKILKISNTNTSNASVWIDAGIHAREWIAPAVATYIANHIATNFNHLPENITNKDWYFLPVVNPDGYVYSHTVDRMWRKNRAWHAGQCVGVDLNRNFSFGWGGKGSSSIPTNAFYRGPAPFSEPESTAMRDILVNSGLSFKVYITLHSYGQVIIFPFAFKEDLCPDYVKLLEGATVMSKAIYETNGNTYKVGISRDVMYGAAGTSNDFSYGEAGIPFCYLIELRSKKHKFKLPKEEIEETGNEILNCVKALMEFVDNCPEKLKT